MLQRLNAFSMSIQVPKKRSSYTLRLGHSEKVATNSDIDVCSRRRNLVDSPDLMLRHAEALWACLYEQDQSNTWVFQVKDLTWMIREYSLCNICRLAHSIYLESVISICSVSRIEHLTSIVFVLLPTTSPASNYLTVIYWSHWEISPIVQTFSWNGVVMAVPFPMLWTHPSSNILPGSLCTLEPPLGRSRCKIHDLGMELVVSWFSNVSAQINEISPLLTYR